LAGTRYADSSVRGADLFMELSEQGAAPKECAE
jgi:hypothetical protein